MNWKLMEDPENTENRNAGNGGDLVKHTVYIAALRYLIAHKPWSGGVSLKECHAGRGVYRIGKMDPRGRLLSCLFSESAGNGLVQLREVQRQVLNRLDSWPSKTGSVEWYAGSALINAFVLSEDAGGCHRAEFLERMPETREILRAVLESGLREPCWSEGVLSQNPSQYFDGEAYIEQGIAQWGRESVVMLDPFAMWRQIPTK